MLKAGDYIRRNKDGMLGRVNRVSRWPYGRQQWEADIRWIDEWTSGTISPSAKNVTLLAGEEEAAAKAEFDALTCPTCQGKGRVSYWDGDKCPAPDCRCGLRLGVRPAFDASFAEYREWLEKQTPPQWAAKAQSTQEAETWKTATLKFPGHCSECSARLLAGEEAQRRKVDGRWEVRCKSHAEEPACCA